MTVTTLRRRALLTVLLLALAVYATRALARSRTFQILGALVARVDASEPVVALTFDDGPTRGRVDRIRAVLAEKHVRATFFVMGSSLAEAPDAGRALVAAGHELGNHTYAHERMVFKSPGFMRAELDRTDRLIREAGYSGPIAFRPPFGYKLVGLPWALWRSGRTTVMWDIEPDSYAHARGFRFVTVRELLATNGVTARMAMRMGRT